MSQYRSVVQTKQANIHLGFTKANSAANYFFWIKSLQPSILEAAENEKKGPSDGCKSYHLDRLEFSYPLAPRHRVLKGVSLKVSSSFL